MNRFSETDLDFTGMSAQQIQLLSSSEPRDIQSYIDEIQNIRSENYNNMDLGVSEETAYLDYANALNDVSSSQTALLLSTQGVGNAQIQQTLAAKNLTLAEQYQAMAEAGLLKSKQSLSNVELQNVIAAKTGNEEYAKAIMNHMGLTVAMEGEEAQTVKLTSKKMQELADTGLLTEAQAQEIAMTTGVSLAVNTQATSVLPKWIMTLKAATLAILDQIKATIIWLATTPAGWATTAIIAIAGVIAVIKGFIKHQEAVAEKIRETAQTAQSNIKELNSAFEETKSKAESALETYNRLAAGMDLLSNKNISLSDDEYKDFISAGNELAELFPQLIKYYDANGNAVLNLGENAAEAEDKINALVNAEKQQLATDLQGELTDTFAGLNQEVKEQSIENPFNISNSSFAGSVKQLQKVQAIIKEITGKELSIQTSVDGHHFIDTYGALNMEEQLKVYQEVLSDANYDELSDTALQAEKVLNEIKKNFGSIEDAIMYLNTDSIQQAYKAQLSDVFKVLSVDDTYASLGDAQPIVSALISNLDYASVADEVAGSYGNDIIAYLQDNIIQPIADSLADEETAAAVQDAYANLMTLNTDEALGDNIEKIRSYITTIADATQRDFDEVAAGLGYDLDAKSAKLSNAMKKVTGTDSLQANSRYDTENAKINQYIATLSEKEIDLLLNIPEDTKIETKEELENYLDNMTNGSTLSDFLSGNKELQQTLFALSKTGKLDIDAISSLEAYDEMLRLCNDDADTLIRQISELAGNSSGPLEAVNDLSSLSGGLGTLADVYQQAMNDGFVESSAIASLYDQFGDLSVFENFVEALQNIGEEGYNTADAFNALADEYISAKLSLNDLTDATKKQYIQELKRQGITNAEAAVEERLAYMNEARAGALQTLSQMQDYASYTAENLANASVDELYAMINSANAAGLDASALQRLAMAKNGVNSVRVDTETDINNLIEMAKAAGVSASMLQIAENAKHFGSAEAVDAVAENLKNAIKQITGIMDAGFSPYQYSGGSKNTSSSGGGSKTAYEETINWIERRIQRLQTKFDRWIKQAETAITSGKIEKYYTKAATQAKNLMSAYSQTYNKYMKKASDVGLSEEYAKKVRNGTISLETIKDENLAKKISTYQDYWDKAQDCLDNYIEQAEALANIPLEKAAAKIEKISDAIELLEAKINNTSVDDYKDANKLINQELKKQEKILTANKTAETEANKALKTAGKTLSKDKNLNSDSGVTKAEKKKILDAIAENKEVNLAYFKEGSAGYKAAVKYNEALKAQTEATQEANLAQEEYNAALVELQKQKFDNIQTYYEAQVQLLDDKFTSIDNKIAELEAAGRNVNKAYYQSQLSINEDIKKQYEEEKKELEEQLASIKEGTEEWYDAKDAIQECENSISDCIQQTYELNNAINELHFQMFDDIADSIDRIIAEQEFLQDLFAHENLADEKTGTLTEAGTAKLGSLSASYYAAKEKAKNDAAEVAELQRMFETGTLKSDILGITFNSVDDLKDKLDEMYTTWQEDIKETYELETDINELMQQKYQAELDLLKELIDARKEALDAEKDLHDYQKTLQEKSKDITTIQKQITAISGDTSQEGLAKLQKLQVQLAEKEEDLRETEYERYISDQQDMLDKLYDEYEELVTKKLDDFMALVREGLKTANDNTQSINAFLNNVATANGYKIETEGLFTTISGNIEDSTAKIVGSIEKYVGSNSGTQDDSTGTSGTEIDTNNSNGSNNTDSRVTSGYTFPITSPISIPFTTDQKKLKQEALDFINKKAIKPSKDKKDYSDVNQKIWKLTGGKILSTTNLKKLTEMVGTTWNNASSTGNLYNALANLKISGFKNGGIVSVDDIAKQVKANGDKVLISANPGEGVLTPVQTELLQRFAQKLPEMNHAVNFMEQLIPVTDQLANLRAISEARNLNNIVNIDTITLPNVTNYDEFKDKMFHDMQKDTKFEGMIRDMSVNQLAGAGRLAKNRHML